MMKAYIGKKEIDISDLATCKECGSDSFGVWGEFMSLQIGTNATLFYCDNCECQFMVATSDIEDGE